MRTEDKPTKETLENWHNNPNNWKWGCIYFNKDDKRIFPPKRNKYMGWTVNFANPSSIITLIVAVILIVVLAEYFKAHR